MRKGLDVSLHGDSIAAGGAWNRVARLTRRFFRGSAEELVLGLVDVNELSAKDLRDIEARLQSASESRGAGKSRRRKP